MTFLLAVAWTQGEETMTSVSASHVILTPAEPVTVERSDQSGNRTWDLLSASHPLYRLSYLSPQPVGEMVQKLNKQHYRLFVILLSISVVVSLCPLTYSAFTSFVNASPHPHTPHTHAPSHYHCSSSFLYFNIKSENKIF